MVCFFFFFGESDQIGGFWSLMGGMYKNQWGGLWKGSDAGQRPTVDL